MFRAKGKLVPGYVPEPDKKPPPHRKDRGGKKKNKNAPAVAEEVAREPGSLPARNRASLAARGKL